MAANAISLIKMVGQTLLFFVLPMLAPSSATCRHMFLLGLYGLYGSHVGPYGRSCRKQKRYDVIWSQMGAILGNMGHVGP